MRTLAGIAALQVDLVDGDDLGTWAAREVDDRFDRLRHHAVIGGDDQEDDIGRLCTACPHGGERLVAGGVDEGDLGAALLDLVGADMWVMPPASPETALALRMASSSDVLPWST